MRRALSVTILALSVTISGCGPTLEQFFHPEQPTSAHDPNFVTCHTIKLMRWSDALPDWAIYGIKIHNAGLRQQCPGQALEYYPVPPLTAPPASIPRPSDPPAAPTS